MPAFPRRFVAAALTVAAFVVVEGLGSCGGDDASITVDSATATRDDLDFPAVSVNYSFTVGGATTQANQVNGWTVVCQIDQTQLTQHRIFTASKGAPLSPQTQSGQVIIAIENPSDRFVKGDVKVTCTLRSDHDLATSSAVAVTIPPSCADTSPHLAHAVAATTCPPPPSGTDGGTAGGGGDGGSCPVYPPNTVGYCAGEGGCPAGGGPCPCTGQFCCGEGFCYTRDIAGCQQATCPSGTGRNFSDVCVCPPGTTAAYDPCRPGFLVSCR